MNTERGRLRGAVAVLNKATQVTPQSRRLPASWASAQSSLGNTEAAILAWQKYLELAPNGDMATVVREQIEELSKTTTTTTATARDHHHRRLRPRPPRRRHHDIDGTCHDQLR